MLKQVSVVRTVIRYWRMAHDPRTPSIVRYMIYGGIAFTLAPKKWIPDDVPGLGLIDEAAVLPGIIAVSMLLIPQEVKEDQDAKSEKGIQRKQVEAIEARPAHEKPLPQAA